jgi:hypothetical protein
MNRDHLARALRAEGCHAIQSIAQSKGRIGYRSFSRCPTALDPARTTLKQFRNC